MKYRVRRFACLFLLCAVLTGTVCTPAEATFSDVPRGHWAEDEIAHCVELGVFGGVSADRFGLGQSMTRSAFAVVLCRFFGWDTTASRPVFSDVPADAWYAGAVTAAYDHGAFPRQRADFRPKEPITREELTVALIRALGYTTLAGRAQELSSPFIDVTTNAGYITLAYDLGLLGGTSATTFSPERTATREQVAVILSRLYRKMSERSLSLAGILQVGETPAAGNEWDAVAVGGARLFAGGLQKTTTEQDAAEALAAAHAAGAQGLLYVTGRGAALQQSAASAAKALAQAVEEGGFDGLFLDITGLTASHARRMTALAQAVDAALGERTFYLTAEALLWGASSGGYEYAALAAAADRLVLRVAPYAEVSGGTMAAPMEPLEEVYYTLRTLKHTVEPDTLSLLLTTTGSAWNRTAAQSPLSAREIAARLEGGAARHYSQRFACAYLTQGSVTVWYLDGQATEARAQLGKLMGLGQLCLSDSADLLPEVAAALEA